MNRNTILLIAALIVLAVIGFSAYHYKSIQPKNEDGPSSVAPSSDTPDAIDENLGSIDTGAGLDAELQATDQDIEKL